MSKKKYYFAKSFPNNCNILFAIVNKWLSLTCQQTIGDAQFIEQAKLYKMNILVYGSSVCQFLPQIDFKVSQGLKDPPWVIGFS